jgi:hypothetical protein
LEYKEKSLKRDEQVAWKPARIDPSEISALHQMWGTGGLLPLVDTKMDKLFQKTHCQTLESIIKNLLETGLFAKENAYLRPISGCTHILTTDDGGGYISDERDKFEAWCEKNSIQPTFMNIIFFE